MMGAVESLERSVPASACRWAAPWSRSARRGAAFSSSGLGAAIGCDASRSLRLPIRAARQREHAQATVASGAVEIAECEQPSTASSRLVRQLAGDSTCTFQAYSTARSAVKYDSASAVIDDEHDDAQLHQVTTSLLGGRGRCCWRARSPRPWLSQRRGMASARCWSRCCSCSRSSASGSAIDDRGQQLSAPRSSRSCWP